MRAWNSISIATFHYGVLRVVLAFFFGSNKIRLVVKSFGLLIPSLALLVMGYVLIGWEVGAMGSSIASSIPTGLKIVIGLLLMFDSFDESLRWDEMPCLMKEMNQEPRCHGYWLWYHEDHCRMIRKEEGVERIWKCYFHLEKTLHCHWFHLLYIYRKWKKKNYDGPSKGIFLVVIELVLHMALIVLIAMWLHAYSSLLVNTRTP